LHLQYIKTTEPRSAVATPAARIAVTLMLNRLMPMVVFLLIFLLLYTGMHAYAYTKLRAGMDLTRNGKILIWVLFGFMILAPIITRLLGYADIRWLSAAMGYLTYSWLGLLFLFIALNFGADLYQWGVKLVGLATSSNLERLLPKPGMRLGVLGMLAAALFIYGFIEAQTMRVEHISIPTTKLNNTAQPIRIAQISDVHLGNMLRNGKVDHIVEIINGLKPDIVVSTGDLVDGDLRDRTDWIASFNKLQAPLGKYAVTGNHEYYAGIDQAVEFTAAAGFEVLRDQTRRPHKALTIVGVNDLTEKRMGNGHAIEEDRLLADVEQDSFVLLLKHQPYINDASTGWFDLQLSGHTHKGQIFPFVLMTRFVFEITHGLAEVAKDSWVYVSRGTGTWGPPIRLLAPPEITLIELQPSQIMAVSQTK